MLEKKTAPQKRGAEPETVKEIMDRYGVSLEELAEVLNTPKETVESWCKGYSVPDTQQIVKTARVLGCTVKEVYLAIICTPVGTAID